MTSNQMAIIMGLSIYNKPLPSHEMLVQLEATELKDLSPEQRAILQQAGLNESMEEDQ